MTLMEVPMNTPDDPPPTPESAAWNEAVDILTGAGVSLDKAASLALTAMGDGRDPVAWARKYIRLRRAARPPE